MSTDHSIQVIPLSATSRVGVLARRGDNAVVVELTPHDARNVAQMLTVMAERCEAAAAEKGTPP